VQALMNSNKVQVNSVSAYPRRIHDGIIYS
jgi:hypothetical protein